ARRQSRPRQLRGQSLRFGRGTLDDRGGQRRGRAGSRAHSGAFRTLRVARRRRLPEPGALRDALRFRRTHGEKVAMSDEQRADALVFFGATGDLAYKKIFPALLAMARRGALDMPVVGVAKSGWRLEQLIERAKASVTESGGFDAAA